MSETPDYTQAGKIFEQSMKDALAHIDKVNAELNEAKEKAIDQEIATRDELLRIQRDAETIAAASIERYHKQYEARIRTDILRDVAEKLLQAGHGSEHVKRWLDIEQDIIDHAWKRLGFEMLDGKAATVQYESQGRSGYVYFNWDGAVIRMYYEFGGGNTLATIDIPPVEKWEKETGFPLDKRDAVLAFIAKRIIRDQAQDHIFEIKDNYIRIYK